MSWKAAGFLRWWKKRSFGISRIPTCNSTNLFSATIYHIIYFHQAWPLKLPYNFSNTDWNVYPWGNDSQFDNLRAYFRVLSGVSTEGNSSEGWHQPLEVRDVEMWRVSGGGGPKRLVVLGAFGEWKNSPGFLEDYFISQYNKDPKEKRRNIDYILDPIWLLVFWRFLHKDIDPDPRVPENLSTRLPWRSWRRHDKSWVVCRESQGDSMVGGKKHGSVHDLAGLAW